MLDRLLHRSVVLKLDGDSYRLRDRSLVSRTPAQRGKQNMSISTICSSFSWRRSAASSNRSCWSSVTAACGLRFGEAIALCVSDVNLDKARIRVRRSATYVRGQGYVEGTTKNHSSRTVPVPTVALEPLREQIGERPAGRLVWPPTSSTRWLTIGALRWVFDPAVKRCVKSSPAFPTITPHQLRHTGASLAISAGANVKVLQTLLGHKTANHDTGSLRAPDAGRSGRNFQGNGRCS